jgi:hypothetical protein
MKRRLALDLFCLVLTSIAIGCTMPVTSIQMGPDAEITHDGLHRVNRTRQLQRVWVKPDLDLTTYSKLLPVNAGIHFKRPPRSGRGEWSLTETQETFVRESLRDALQSELESRGEWEFVTDRGPHVLVMRGAIIDLVVTASGRDTGRNRSYGQSVGQATLVVELFDSQSMEILVRIADRREITRDHTSWRNDTITNQAAATKTFREWARRLTNGLEFARTIDLPSDVPSEGEN